MELKTQKCNGCKTMRKPSDFIYKEKKHKTCGYCSKNREKNKEKQKEQNKKWYEANKEKKKEQVKEYYEENKGKINENSRVYYEANKDKIIEKKKIYYEANKDKINEKHKVYREENADKIKDYKKEYNERMKQENPLLYKLRKMVESSKATDIQKNRYNETDFVSMEHLFKLMEIQEGKCVYCDVEMLVDDFTQAKDGVSIQRIDNSKGHNKSNCVMCCFKCNCCKMEEGKSADFYNHILEQL